MRRFLDAPDDLHFAFILFKKQKRRPASKRKRERKQERESNKKHKETKQNAKREKKKHEANDSVFVSLLLFPFLIFLFPRTTAFGRK